MEPAARLSAIIPQTAIAANVRPERGVTSMQLRLRTDGRAWHPAADSTRAATQSAEGEATLVTQALLDSVDPGPADSTFDGWLADSPFLGLGDSVIASQARAILAGTRDGRGIAGQLAAWVSQNIARTSDPLVPRAATVLRERQADVDGHTLLFVALARSAGLPARPVSGILLAEGRFYLHSWAEVYLGRWVPVDPTWGEFPAPANRVRMATGSLARPLDLLPLVAGLEADLITLTHQP
jgi:transglutaminase-like putative cysteine protease